MDTEEIKAAVEAVRHREQQRAGGEPLGCPCCGGEATMLHGLYECNNLGIECGFTVRSLPDDWNTRPAQAQADRALIALAAREQRLREFLSLYIDENTNPAVLK